MSNKNNELNNKDDEINLNNIKVNITEIKETDILQNITEKNKYQINNDIISQKKTYNQDNKQYIKSTFTFLVELYRVIMGSFLILFIPQDCGGNICSFSENMNSTQIIKQATLYINLITFLSLFNTYLIEYYREISLIKYLDVNKFKSNDNISIGKTLEGLSVEFKNKLWYLDKLYKNITYISLFCFFINTVVSCIAIFSNYLDTKTITIFATNFLFIIFKIIDIFTIVNTSKNIFYSAYIKKKIQFNDIDNDYIKS